MKIEYDYQADAIYLYLSSKKEKVYKSKEVENGVVLDLNKKNQVVGVEILEVARRFKPSELFQFSVRHLSQMVNA